MPTTRGTKGGESVKKKKEPKKKKK